MVEGGARLVAAIELVSPANKDRAAHRRAFATCASHLCQGVGLVIVDIVTSWQAGPGIVRKRAPQVLDQDRPPAVLLDETLL